MAAVPARPAALEVQAGLPEGVTLVEYLVTERVTIVWLVDRAKVTALRLPVGRAVLVEKVRHLRQGIVDRAPLESIQPHARGLYEMLFDAVRAHIRGSRLVIVPHDVLHYLPFGALQSGEGRWLVEEFVLATLPSASVLKYLAGKGEQAPERALAVGNPARDQGSELPFAEREARMVGQYFTASSVLLRAEATKEQVKALSGTAGLIHFATHADLSEEDPLSSALLLAGGGTESGRLETREIFRMELQARLVVLSACETGLGKLSRGDELVGLQRAFIYAGTPAVMTTLWKVDDRATYELMRGFYAELKAHGAAEALGNAQRRFLKGNPHPFDWAAFTLTGVPR